MKKRKSIIYTIILVLLINWTSVLAVSDSEFASNERYYRNLCSTAETAKNNKQLCSDYNIYLNGKIEAANEKVNEYRGKINEYKEDYNKQVELANEYQGIIDGFTVQITDLEADITRLEESIEQIEAEIIEREAEIEEKDRIILERMQKTQSDIRFGYEIDFLFKSLDFASLIASVSIVNDIMDYEAIQIEEINVLIEEQREAQFVMEQNRITINLNIEEIARSKASVEVLKAEVDIAVENYQKLMREMTALQDQSKVDAANIRKQIEANKEALNLDGIISSGSFIRPISDGYLSAGVWAYPAPWSAGHFGFDYAASVGTIVRAAGNGIVIMRGDGCPTMGYLGNSCGGLKGNYAILLVTVNNKLYSINYYHMQQGSVIGNLQKVSAGQTIGRVGSSGNSTGPHVHTEVRYLGTSSIESYLNRWNGSMNHGVPTTLGARCSVKSAPCLMHPGDAFGNN